MKITSFKYPRVGFLVAIFVCSVFFVFYTLSHLHVTIKMSSTADSSGQIFTNIGKGYRPEFSNAFHVFSDGRMHTYSIRLSEGLIHSLRIDPATAVGKIVIHQIKIENYFYNQTINLSQVNLIHDLTLLENKETALVMKSFGGDPYFDFRVTHDFQILKFINWAHISFFILLGIICYWIFRNFIYKKVVLILKDNNGKDILFYFFLATGFILFLVFNFNLSSLPEWRSYVTPKYDTQVVFGKSRGIRSDEWMVQTPYYASQILNNFSLYNVNIGPGKSTLLAGVPVSSIYGYCQPRFWGFYIAGFDYGLSWLYAFRLFGLLFSSFLLFKLISKNEFWLSITGSFWVTFSSFTQWWFSTNLPDMMIGAFLSIFALYSLWYSKTRFKQVLYSVTLFFSAFTFVTALYPPFQVPLAYLSIFTLMGLFLRDNFKLHFSYFKVICVFLPILLNLIIIFDWWMQASDVIKLVLDSAYPGKRISLGGDLKFYQYISGYLGPFVSESIFPIILGNICEASNFYYVFILLFLFFFYGNRKNILENPLNIFLFIYSVLIFVWLFCGYGQFFATLTKMSMSPPNRALFGLGLVNIFLCISVFSSELVGTKVKIKPSVIVLLLIFSIAVLFAYIVYIIFPDFIGYRRFLITFCFTWLFSYSFVCKNKMVFIFSVFLVVFNGAFVNPIVRGTAIIHDTTLNNVLSRQGLNSSRKWIVFSDTVHVQYFTVHAQYLKAHGEKVMNGTKYMVDLSDMKILDPSGKYQKIWYRYSHLVVVNDNQIKQPEFHLQFADSVMLKVDVCSREIKRLGITHVAFLSPQDLNEITCLKLIHQTPVDGMWLYSIK